MPFYMSSHVNRLHIAERWQAEGKCEYVVNASMTGVSAMAHHMRSEYEQPGWNQYRYRQSRRDSVYTLVENFGRKEK